MYVYCYQISVTLPILELPQGCNGHSCLSEAHNVSLHKPALTQMDLKQVSDCSFDVHIANGLAASRMNWFICYVANSQVGWMQSSTDHRSKVMLPAQDYLFHPPSSLPYLTVNWHILFAKLLWFQGRNAVDELLAIPRDASWSCPLRKLRHLSGEIVRRVQVHDVLIYTVIRQKKSRSYHHLPPKDNEREMMEDANGTAPWTFLGGNRTCFQGEHDRFHYVLHRHWKKLLLQNPR